MGQEFVIKSTTLEDKINQLLPSQGGAQAGVDLSASTTIIPIVDLTESAEGSVLRQDLQTALSFTKVTSTSATNQTVTVINTTGYWRVFGQTFLNGGNAELFISDGLTNKRILRLRSNTANFENHQFDFIIKLEAGDSLVATAGNVANIDIAHRQVATLSGELVNP